MLLATNMVSVCIFTEVCSLTDRASLFVSGFGGFGSRRCLGLDDLLGEDF